MRYCSRACQKKDWRGHKRECATLKVEQAAGRESVKAAQPDGGPRTKTFFTGARML